MFFCDKAMKGLEGSVKDMKGEGFFAADIKMPTGADKKKQVDFWFIYVCMYEYRYIDM